MEKQPRGTPSSETSEHSAEAAIIANAIDADAVEFKLVITMLVVPGAALTGMFVKMEFALLVVIFAGMPPMVTEAPASPDPLMVIGVPAEPEVGVTAMLLGAGSARTVKAAVAGANVPTLTTTPPTDVAVAALGTLVVITVPLLLATVASRPPIRTVAPVRKVPVIVTTVLAVPVDGDTEAIAGAAWGGGSCTVKAKVAGVRPATVATMPPTEAAVAVGGTLVVMARPVLLAITAARPPMVTPAPAKFAPLMVTCVPG